MLYEFWCNGKQSIRGASRQSLGSVKIGHEYMVCADVDGGG